MAKYIIFSILSLTIIGCNWEGQRKPIGFTSGEVISIGERYDMLNEYVLVDTNKDKHGDIPCMNDYFTDAAIGKSVDVAIYFDSVNTYYYYYATIRE